MDAVAARLGYRPWDGQADRMIEVTVDREGGVLRARVRMREPSGAISGTRALWSEQHDCSELAAAVELAISIAIDPLGTAAPASMPAPPPAEHPAPPPSSVPVAPESLRSAPKKHRTARCSLSTSIGGVVAVGAAPRVAGGFVVQGRVRRRRLSLALEGRLDLPAADEVRGGEISSSLMLGSIVPCFHLGRFMGCGLLGVGALRGAGHSLTNAETVTLPYAALGARIGVELPLVSVVSVRVSADLLGTLSRISLRESGTGVAFWTSPPVSGAFGLAVVGEIW
jgi:hypothetical protein